ncbi:hypothetical protein [Nonomuraea recticatena]|uniref:hypothetical protein n=1 Tax=Nonomuraea recticatena TaxID=46178 RepID=UPI00361DC3CE
MNQLIGISAIAVGMIHDRKMPPNSPPSGSANARAASRTILTSPKPRLLAGTQTALRSPASVTSCKVKIVQTSTETRKNRPGPNPPSWA